MVRPGVNGCLHVVADDAGAAPTGRHRAGIGIRERDLLIGHGEALLVDGLQALHLFGKRRDFFIEAVDPHRAGLGVLLAIGALKLMHIARDALLDLRHPPRHLALGEVAVAIVDRLELRAVDGNRGDRQQSKPAAQFDETSAYLADRGAAVLAEVGDRLVIRCEAPCQPHHFDVTVGLTFQPAA